ncbi:MAG: TolB family protein [Candidatus Acidiferrales bacterium]
MNFTGGKFRLLIAVLALLGASLWIVRGADELHAASNSRLSGVSTSGASPRESVRAELVRLQAQTGLTLASYYRGLDLVSFNKREMIQGKEVRLGYALDGAVSRDGNEIAVQMLHLFERRKATFGIIRPDGELIREYPEVVLPQHMCWAYDNTKFGLVVLDKPPDSGLRVLNLASGAWITPEIDARADITSQCFSPDGKNIVYDTDDSVRIYEIGKERSSIRILAKGKQPTWSPDGEWIAFLDDDTYYTMRPNGEDRRELFHKTDAESGLFWSPDSRIVAFVSEAGLSEGVIFADPETYRLRVRRLEDNSEDWVADSVAALGNYQWVTNAKLAAQ